MSDCKMLRWTPRTDHVEIRSHTITVDQQRAQVVVWVGTLMPKKDKTACRKSTEVLVRVEKIIDHSSEVKHPITVHCARPQCKRVVT